jgi:hypothetical protein
MSKEKYGFVYIWFDRKHKRYYIGSHWGTEDDGYICSSRMMRQSYNRRKEDFRRRIIKRIYTNRKDLLIEEERWLSMIDPNKTTPRNSTIESRKNARYYNIKLGTQNHWWSDIDSSLTVGEKISAAKKGKKTGPRPEVGPAISAAKKGKPLTEEHKASLRGIKKKPHTEEWKQQNSERFKQIWSDPEFRARQSETRKAAWIKRKQRINNI